MFIELIIQFKNYVHSLIITIQLKDFKRNTEVENLYPNNMELEVETIIEENIDLIEFILDFEFPN